MSQFVKIVRPFQLNISTPPRRILDPNATPPSNVVLEIGKGGSPKSVSGSISYSWRGYMKKKVKERGRGHSTGGG